MALRRLAYERSWFFVVVALWGAGGVVYFCLEVGTRGLANGDVIVPAFAVPVLVLMFRRGLTGSRSKRQLWIDVPAGKLVLPDGTEHALGELGALAIEKRYQRRLSGARDPIYFHELRAAGLDRPVFSSVFERDTTRRLAALERAVVQSAVRRLLERPPDDGAFRAGPELASEVLARAGSSERALDCLRALADEDHDAAIREQAATLIAAVTSRTTGHPRP